MENGGTREMDSERTRKRMPTHQHDCLKGKGGATEQKQGGERSCFRASLTLDSQELQTPALRKKKFQFKKKKKSLVIQMKCIKNLIDLVHYQPVFLYSNKLIK